MKPLMVADGELHRVGVPGQTGVTSMLEALIQAPIRGGIAQPLSDWMLTVPIGEIVLIEELQSR